MIKGIIGKNPLIAACEFDTIEYALKSKASAIIYMNSDLNVLVSDEFKKMCRIKPIFIHMDLLRGMCGDKESIRFLHKYVNPAGIVSTKGSILRAAKKEGVLTIQRTFLIDTKSFEYSINAIKENNPDAVEVMPAIAPAIVSRIKELVNNYIILGGLINDEAQIIEALKNRADAVSLSKKELWNKVY